MRNTLLATVAAAALAAGTVMVSAQGTGGGAGGGSPPSAAPPPSSAPAEKMDRGGGKSDRGAQTAPKGDKGERSTTGQTERGGQGQERGKSGTTGQGQMEPGQKGQMERGQTGEGTKQERGQGAQQNREQGQTPRTGQTKDGDTQRGATSKDKDGDSQRGAASKGGGTGSASLSTEQRTQIKTTVLRGGGAPKVSRSEINFNISVGTSVPRSVRLVTVPTTIVEIHPAWRGYMYFVVDEEIIIVEPGSLRIVAVIS
jgi:hypothetical protein